MEKSRTALIVDDDKDICRFIKESLESLTYFHQILVAHDGAEANRKVYNQDFELIILDLKMPKLDGIAVVKILVEQKNLNPEKIVLISGNMEADDIKLALKWNVRNIILKPFNGKLFLEKIQEIIGRIEKLKD